MHKKNPQSTIDGPPAIPHPRIEKCQMYSTQCVSLSFSHYGDRSLCSSSERIQVSSIRNSLEFD